MKRLLVGGGDGGNAGMENQKKNIKNKLHRFTNSYEWGMNKNGKFWKIHFLVTFHCFKYFPDFYIILYFVFIFSVYFSL